MKKDEYIRSKPDPWDNLGMKKEDKKIRNRVGRTRLKIKTRQEAEEYLEEKGDT